MHHLKKGEAMFVVAAVDHIRAGGETTHAAMAIGLSLSAHTIKIYMKVMDRHGILDKVKGGGCVLGRHADKYYAHCLEWKLRLDKERDMPEPARLPRRDQWGSRGY